LGLPPTTHVLGTEEEEEHRDGLLPIAGVIDILPDLFLSGRAKEEEDYLIQIVGL